MHLAHQSKSIERVRVLHSVGHLLRGGIEKWLYETLAAQPSAQFAHHILVRTAEEESFTNAFREAGIPVHVCASFTNPVLYARDFRQIVREHGPYDILHVHGSSYSGLLALALAKSAGIPKSIVHSHNDVRPHLKDRSYLYGIYVGWVLKAYRALGDCGFAASLLAAESMFGLTWERDKRWNLLYYGVDCTPFERPVDPTLRTTLGIAPDAHVVGHVGRFHEQKNHAFLLDIVEAAVALRPNVHCLLIGDGPLREQVTADIRRRGLLSHFTFVPDTTSVSDYMLSAMDCFVFPSRYEGLGLVAVEAQAAGLSCLISDRVPAEAIVTSSLVRVLELEDSPTEWAHATLGLIDAPREPKDVALARVKNSRFNLNHCVTTLQARYLQLARESWRDQPAPNLERSLGKLL